MEPRSIRIADFDYHLPEERIAPHPCEPRDACRLLVRRAGLPAGHLRFTDLPGQLPEGALLVCNNTRVINARIKMRKPTGAEIEIFCLEPYAPRDYARAFQAVGSCEWSALVGNAKRWKQGAVERACTAPAGTPFTLSAECLGELEGGERRVRLSWDAPSLTFAEVIAAAGYIPIPPYLCRESQECDAVDYQTVYSRIKGSVAAPTAGLHFTPAVLEAVRSRGVDIRELTLHVGAGTFRPVKSDTIGDHPMHTETVQVERALLSDIIGALRSGRPVIATGTTTVRTLESLPLLAFHTDTLHVEQWEAYSREFDTVEALESLASYMDARDLESLTATTAIMIAPGFPWRVVGGMVTNFHQPQSTLLLLVASWLESHGGDEGEWRRLYAEALEGDYRFLSYGDSMLLLP